MFEVLEYNEIGKIIAVDTEVSSIRLEYDENGKIKKQYKILSSENGKEIVGMIQDKNGVRKIINNSTLPESEVIKINEEMEQLEIRYMDNTNMMYDVIFWDGGVEITENYYAINNSLDLKKRLYDKLENNVDYHIEEVYKNGKLFGYRKINKKTKTELYTEEDRKFIKGFDGIEKEVTLDEFNLYKMADELNKI